MPHDRLAALYVQPGGVYWDLPGVEPWGLPERDARDYAGPWPVVAHPPCARWCMLAGLVQAVYGHKIGDDGGCFRAALAAVQQWGGVLEHPAWSKAWKAHDLNHPPSSGGWVNADFNSGWTCYVEQWRYGHLARKATWLLVYGASSLPTLKWGLLSSSSATMRLATCKQGENRYPKVWVSSLKNHDCRKRLNKAESSASPIPFRDLLINIAKGCEI